MQLCNDTITLYNRRFDPEQDCDVYERTIIRGVHWFNSDATTVDSTGLKAANKVTIRIPVDADFGGKAYLLPKQYAAADDPAAAFTLAAGDLVVLGVGAEGLRLPPSMTPIPRLQPSCRSLTTAAPRRRSIGKL